MVCRGPSKGCNLCRARKVKCDEERPSCRRCVKSGRFCPGYENYSAFRNKFVSDTPRFPVEKSTSVIPAAKKQTISVPDIDWSQLVPGPLPKSMDQAICILFTQVGPMGGALSQAIVDMLSPLYTKANSHPVVSATTEALAMNHLLHSSADPVHKSQALSSNVHALNTMNKTLRDPSAIESKESVEAILLGILALCMRQSSAHASNFPYNDSNHARGCLAVLKAWAQRCPELGFSPDLVWVIRTIMTWASLESSNSTFIDETNACIKQDAYGTANFPARAAMVSILRRLVEVRAKQKDLESQPQSPEMISEVMTLFDDAKSIDAMMTGEILPAIVQSRHPFTVEPSPFLSEDPSGPDFIHIYDNASGAILWMRLHGFRLMTLGTMVRSLSFLETEGNLDEPLQQRLWVEEALCEVVDDLCASFAYCFGDVDNAAHRSQRSQRDRGPWSITPDKTVLVWDICWISLMACEYDCVPLAQRQWMKRQVAAYEARLQLNS